MLHGFGEALDSFRKLTPVPLLALGFATAVILFAPEQLSGTLGIDQFRKDCRFWIGVVFISSWCYLVAHSIWWGRGSLIAWRKTRHAKQVREQYLQELTPAEKKCLQPYIRQEKNTRHFDCTNGIVGGLHAKGILFRSSNMMEIDKMPYNLQPWARKYLTVHPQLLNDQAETSSIPFSTPEKG